jgi:biotin carboxyl carrier protein
MKKFNVTVNGNAYEVEVEEIGAAAAPAAAPVAAPAAAPAAPAAAGAADVTCPMPGTIVDIKVKAGDAVKAGDVLVIFEAMKMENEIQAAADGTVAAVYVNKGDSVESGQALLAMN